MKAEELKLIVKDKYSEIADEHKAGNKNSCCGGSGCCESTEYTVFSEDYSGQKGYNPDADLGLGCGIPLEFAALKEGDKVLDLGSGAGNDCFIAATIVRDKGFVTGLDFTEAMVKKAEINRVKTGLNNIEFLHGDIENMPLPDNQFDVVISNCVLNLVPDKQKAFSEMYRILRPGGHFCVSDIVLEGLLPDAVKKSAEMYAGCVSGAIRFTDYMGIIEQQGFKNIKTRKRKEIKIPDSILLKYLNSTELEDLKKKKAGVLSVTVTAYK
ncbi:MAG: arsenite methyltransferase [Bacteroidales bacterium]|nr:arsenite methyltransferase [Bacteroidales bacterium]